MRHELKIWPEYFKAILKSNKTFEIRKNDRDYKVGDLLVLKEYDPDFLQYTGREIHCEVGYITDFKLQEDFVCMGIKLI